MNSKLSFAHITDIHFSEHDHSWGTVTGLAPRLMRECVAHLNTLSALDFVLITGDVMDVASRGEAEAFLDIIAGLDKPWHFLPGNHDGFIDPNHPQALEPHEAAALLDPRLADLPCAPQHTFWSRTVTPGIQLMALDTRIANDWSGVVEQHQIDWLEGELQAHQGDLVIVATHHPLHKLGPHNTRGRLQKFICSNGADVEAVLDRYPSARLVVSGHHHANHLSLAGHRLRVATAALTGYPCSYRTIDLAQIESGWQVGIQTHSTADADILQSTYQIALGASLGHEFNPDDPTAWPAFCAGRPEDLSYNGLLP